jgi:hypothetical protein
MQAQQMLLLAHKYAHIHAHIYASGIQALTQNIFQSTLLVWKI